MKGQSNISSQGLTPMRHLGTAQDGRLSRSLGSRLHRVDIIGSSTTKSGLIYYLAKLA